MCLKKVEFNMEYDANEGCFIGTGYKTMRVTDINGRLNPSCIKKYYGTAVEYREDGWLEARGNWCYNIQTLDNTIHSDNFEKYFPGFHIFLRKEDAQAYGGTGEPVVEVKFAEVTGFGTNTTGTIDDGKCVIARYMKVVKQC